jgi:mRNA-degrading endonuclease RelE of RelBE toxin-antitoxin system
MTHDLEWTAAAERDLQHLDQQAREQIRQALERLMETSQGDVRRLEGRDREWRLRVGNFRVRLHTAAETTIVLRVLVTGPTTT